MTETTMAQAGSDSAARTTQVHQIYLKATPEKVWAAITDPAWNDKYGYHCVSEFDLRQGGAYRVLASQAMLEMGGTPDVIIQGEVLESDPPKRLVQTWQALFSPEITAEGPTRLTYELEEAYGGTKLTLTHELAGAPLTAEQTAGNIPNAGGGWPFILSDLKTWVETGQSMSSGVSD